MSWNIFTGFYPGKGGCGFGSLHFHFGRLSIEEVKKYLAQKSESAPLKFPVEADFISKLRFDKGFDPVIVRSGDRGSINARLSE